MKRLALVVILALLVGNAHARDLRVSAAVSLTEALNAVVTVYEQRTHERVICNFGGSSLLARQIEEGAPADVFFSADEAQMARLARQRLVVRRSIRAVVGNTLVIVANGATIHAPRDLVRVRRLALASPQVVPAGVYAKQYLAKVGLWDALAKKVVPTENVRAALAAVDSGDAEAAIVYATDAPMARRARVAYAVPRGDGPRIVYPAAVVAASRAVASAQRFVDFLRSPEAQAIFRRYGFLDVR